MRPTLTVEQILVILTDTPGRIAECTAGLTETQLNTPPVRGERSVHEVLAHLRSCADAWGSGITTIIRREIPTIHAVNPGTWAGSTDYLSQKFRSSPQTYTEQRAELLTVLKPLGPGDWSQTVIMTGDGKPREESVHTYAFRMARHERTHVKELQSMVRKLMVGRNTR